MQIAGLVSLVTLYLAFAKGLVMTPCHVQPTARFLMIVMHRVNVPLRAANALSAEMIIVNYTVLVSMVANAR